MLKPEPISGFPEFLPEEQIVFQWALGLIRRTFEAYGFVPVETPAVERVDVLLTKGGNDREIYGLRRLAAGADDAGAKDLALHFDLTVPLARYVAQHYGRLTFPFRRYQIQPVWRGERAQAGRYREFYQCDIDTIGDGELSLLNDAEIPSVIHRLFSEMEIGPFTIRINNRKVLQGLVSSLGIAEGEPTAEVLRIVDRLEKVGADKVRAMLADAGVAGDGAARLLALTEQELDTDGWLAYLQSQDVNETYAKGVEELAAVVASVRSLGVPDERFAVDPSIARGLDYYTGTIYETRLDDHPELGSICSGGRYDNLAGHFTNRPLPGVGISIGLTRLIPRLIEAGVLKADTSTTAPVLVTLFDAAEPAATLAIAATLRDAGIGVETYLERRKLDKQLKYASKRGFSVVVVAGPDEVAQGTATVKDLRTGEQQVVPLADLPAVVKGLLG